DPRADSSPNEVLTNPQRSPQGRGVRSCHAPHRRRSRLVRHARSRRSAASLSRVAPVKGVILAGGKGTRLYPLTRITNKHLLPIYDRPMVTYAIEALVAAGIGDLMVVTGGTHAGEFLRLLGNGQAYGIERLSYGYQEEEGGIAEALGLAERFADGDPIVVMLADNIVGRSLG